MRRYDDSKTIVMNNDAGEYVEVNVKVYYGGDDTDGLLTHEIFCHQILPNEYKP